MPLIPCGADLYSFFEHGLVRLCKSTRNSLHEEQSYTINQILRVAGGKELLCFDV